MWTVERHCLGELGCQLGNGASCNLGLSMFGVVSGSKEKRRLVVLRVFATTGKVVLAFLPEGVYSQSEALVRLPCVSSKLASVFRVSSYTQAHCCPVPSIDFRPLTSARAPLAKCLCHYAPSATVLSFPHLHFTLIVTLFCPLFSRLIIALPFKRSPYCCYYNNGRREGLLVVSQTKEPGCQGIPCRVHRHLHSCGE